MSNKFLITLILTVMIISQSCSDKPTAGFRVEPRDNPEAGDTIKFINESIDALSYEWDFGNGTTSEEEMPYTIYDEPGVYDVLLNAINEDRTDTSSMILQIYDPTIMSFFVYKTDTTPIFACNMWVYTDSSAYYNFAEPEFSSLTDEEGYAEFQNMEDTTYYVLIFKETSDGLYIGGGSVESLFLNEVNIFTAFINFFPNEEKKSLQSEAKHAPPLYLKQMNQSEVY